MRRDFILRGSRFRDERKQVIIIIIIIIILIKSSPKFISELINTFNHLLFAQTSSNGSCALAKGEPDLFGGREESTGHVQPRGATETRSENPGPVPRNGQ